jgi:hypothetical protein
MAVTASVYVFGFCLRDIASCCIFLAILNLLLCRNSIGYGFSFIEQLDNYCSSFRFFPSFLVSVFFDALRFGFVGVASSAAALVPLAAESSAWSAPSARSARIRSSFSYIVKDVDNLAGLPAALGLLGYLDRKVFGVVVGYWSPP